MILHYLKPLVIDGKLVVPEEDIRFNREYMYLRDGQWIHGRLKSKDGYLTLVSDRGEGSLLAYAYVYSIEQREE